MKKNTWKQDTLARDFDEACKVMRLWMLHEPTRLLELKDTDLAELAEVALRLHDATVLLVDDRQARERTDAQVLQTLERIARIGGRVDVTG